MHVAAAHANFGVVAGEIFRHALGQRGDQHALVALGAIANLGEQVVDLAFHRANLDFGIDEAGGPNHLLDDDSRGARQLIRARRCGNVDRLVHAILELLKFERAIVHGRGQAEAVVNQVLLAARSPCHMPCTCGIVAWLSSTKSRKSRGK